PFAKRQQAELHLEGLAASGLAQGFDIEDRDAVLDAVQEVLEFGGLGGGEDGQAHTEDFVARVAVHAFGGGVPFDHAQFGIVEDDRAGEGFQQSAVEVARAAQFGLAFSALADHKRDGPKGQKKGGGYTARDVEVMQSDVVGIAEELVFDQFPSRQNHRDDRNAGERQGRPEPPFFRHRANDAENSSYQRMPCFHLLAGLALVCTTVSWSLRSPAGRARGAKENSPRRKPWEASRRIGQPRDGAEELSRQAPWKPLPNQSLYGISTSV